MLDPARTSSAAADTGTAAHFAISQFHKGETVSDALKQMNAEAPVTFPLADLQEAEKFVRSYTQDPRNGEGAVVAAELQVSFTLPPHRNDPTGAAIHVTGTCDQVRRNGGTLEVWDYKTGADDGVTMLHEFTMQLCGYTIGVRRMFSEPVTVGGIIRGRGYQTRGKAKDDPSPPGVFFHASVDDAQIEACMYRIRSIVAALRRGELLLGPGKYCNYCPHEGITVCEPEGRRLGLALL